MRWLVRWASPAPQPTTGESKPRIGIDSLMFLRRSWGALALAACVLIAVADTCPTSTATSAAPPPAGAQLFASAAVGRPVATSRAVFWADLVGAHTLIR